MIIEAILKERIFGSKKHPFRHCGFLLLFGGVFESPYLELYFKVFFNFFVILFSP